MWVRVSTILVGVVALSLLSSPIRAQSLLDVRLLTPRELERLNKQAREAYEQGVKALDHVDAPIAIQHFDQASQLDPEATELHFLASRIAMLRGRTVFRDEAAKCYETAEKALDRISKEKDLSPLMKQRYETAKKLVSEEKKKIEARDARRKAIGDAFRKIYAAETYAEAEVNAGEGGAAKSAVAVKRAEGGGASAGGGVAVAAGGASRSASDRPAARSDSGDQGGRRSEGNRGGGRSGGGGRAGGGGRGGRGRG